MSIFSNLNEFFQRCIRVWKITKKPNTQEFKTVSKVSAIGILIIGLVGFIISFIVFNLFKIL